MFIGVMYELSSLNKVRFS